MRKIILIPVGRVVSPKIHMLKLELAVPEKVIIFENRGLKSD